MNLHIYDKKVEIKKNNKNIHISWNDQEVNFILEKNKRKIQLNYIKIIHNIVNKYSINLNHIKVETIDLMKMSLINEKNPFKSPEIFNCLKLLTIEIIVKKKRINKIYYHGKIYKVHKSLQLFCKKSDLIYSNKKFISTKLEFKFYHFLKGIIFLLINLLKNFNLKKNLKNYSQISFFSYFVHFKTILSQKFNSNLWGDLPIYLNLKKKNINWFHFFVPSNQIRNASLANNLIKKFNLNRFENHNFINSYLTFKNFSLSFYFYLVVFFKNIFLINSSYNFFNNNFSKTNFYYFLQEDFYSSLFGTTLIYNIMNIFSLNSLISEIPKQKFGLYIIENQSWEYCLIKLWKKYNHGKLIAYFNSSIRFWDLRYSKNKSDLRLKNENPDFYFINSKIFESEAVKIGYPKKKLFLVEGLRYNNLIASKKINKNKKILLVGDILFKETINLLDFVDNILPKLHQFKFYFKPHPTMTSKSINILKSKYPYLEIKNINTEKFKNFEFVICSNGTSASLDCLALRINFCSIRPINSLNLFPIEYRQKLFQVKNSNDLIKKIKKPNKFSKIKIFEKSKKLHKFIRVLNKVS